MHVHLCHSMEQTTAKSFYTYCKSSINPPPPPPHGAYLVQVHLRGGLNEDKGLI